MSKLVKVITLLIFWLVLSGAADWQHLLVGMVAALMVTVFWHLSNRQRKFIPAGMAWGVPLLLVMIVEIWRSAWQVAVLILARRQFSSQFVTIRTPLKGSWTRVLLANCISLTPGTLTVSLEDDQLLVHALTRQHAEALKNWRVHRLLQQMEGAR